MAFRAQTGTDSRDPERREHGAHLVQRRRSAGRRRHRARGCRAAPGTRGRTCAGCARPRDRAPVLLGALEDPAELRRRPPRAIGGSARAPGQLLEDPRIAERRRGRPSPRRRPSARRRRATRSASPSPPEMITGQSSPRPRSSATSSRGQRRSPAAPCGGRRPSAGGSRSRRPPPPRPGAARGRSPARSPGSGPERSFTVTGRPEPSPAARATATARSGSSSSAAPAPVFTTLRTGQPMLRSIRSAPASATRRRGRAHRVGVRAEELDRDRMLVGMDPQHLVAVRSLPWWSAKLETISETAMPGAVAARLQAHEPVADPGQRREQDAVRDLDVGDPERACQRRLRHSPKGRADAV